MSIADKLTQIAENEQKVYDSGYSKAECEWWNAMTANGVKEYYNYFFYDSNLTGKALPDNLKIKGAQYMFYSYRGRELPSNLDLSTLDTTSITAAVRIFSSMFLVERIYDVKIPELAGFNHAFSYCRNLKTIDMPIKSRAETTWNNTFYQSPALENLTIEGVIGQNGFNVQWSTKLSKDSIASIINALSYDTTGLTVIFSLAAVNKGFETSEGANDGSTADEWLIRVSDKSNWTISLV